MSTSVPAAVILKAVRGWRLFPCRTEVDRAVMAAHPSYPAGGTGCRWLMLAAEMVGLAGGSWRSTPDPALTGWACPQRIATRALEAEPRSVRAARYFTVATLSRWGTAHSSQDIAIVVSEMVTNALRHAMPEPGDTGPRRPVRLGLLQQGPWVLCAVADPGNAVPVPRTAGSLAEAGRGLQMICAFSDLWGYTTPSEAGKVVWAMFTARHAPPSPARNPGRPGRDPMPEQHADDRDHDRPGRSAPRAGLADATPRSSSSPEPMPSPEGDRPAGPPIYSAPPGPYR